MTQMKSVIALSKQFAQNPAIQMNAVGHLSQALGHAIPELQCARYATKDNQELGCLSWWPLIILAGSPAKIRNLWQAACEQDWTRACFTETMVAGGSEAQLEATSALEFDHIPLVGLAVYGAAVDLDPCTRKLSLWKSK